MCAVSVFGNDHGIFQREGLLSAAVVHRRLDQTGRRKKGLPVELSRLQRLVQAGLTTTQKLWLPIQQAYAWLHQAAHLLANAEQRDVTTLQQEYQLLLETMTEHQDE